MRSIAVMDIFDQFCCVCIEGDPRQGSPFSAQYGFCWRVVCSVLFFVGVCISLTFEGRPDRALPAFRLKMRAETVCGV